MRSISAAANGAVRPKSVMLIDIAAPIEACDQPNSMCSGSIITLGTERNPAAPSSATNVTAATIQAQCGTNVRVGVRFTTITLAEERAFRPVAGLTTYERIVPCLAYTG